MSSLLKTIKNIIYNTLNYSVFVIYKYNGSPKNLKKLQNNCETRLITKQELINCNDETIYKQAWYGGDGSYIFACVIDECIVALCVYWYGERYLTRNFWPLKEKEAKLVQLYTAPDMRGKGIAPILIQDSCNAMLEKGFNNIFARIWHSNYPSRKAFEKSNWIAISTVIEIQPIRKIKPFRFCIKKI